MIAVKKAFESHKFSSKILLQVHDELVFESPQDEIEVVSTVVRNSMENALKLDVPLVVEIGYGDSWLKAH